MHARTLFRSFRLNGRAPCTHDAGLYGHLFGPAAGAAQLAADLQDWARNQIAPWVVVHAEHPVGVAGFRTGRDGEGLNLSFHFLPELAGQGLASEFVHAALDHAGECYQEDRFFAHVATDNPASFRVLEKAGFVGDPPVEGQIRMRLTLRSGAAADQAGPAA